MTATIEAPPITKLDYALRAAARGIRVHPLRVNGKEATLKDWPKLATTDEAQIRAWWASSPNANIGWATGDQLPDGRFMMALDVDMKRDKEDQLLKNGESTLDALTQETRVIPPKTFYQSTPSGIRPDGTMEGGHLLFSTSRLVASGTDVLGSGLDVRGKGGYVVGDGSEIDGRPYSAPDMNAPILPLPEPWEARLSVAVEKEPDRTPVAGVDPGRACGWAVDHLQRTPGAKQGSRGSTAYRVACELRDRGCSEADALFLMDLHWVEKCEPPMPADDLAESVDHAYRYAKNRPGSSAPEAVFEAVEVPEAEKTRTNYDTLEDRTDTGNANLLIRLSAGNLRYVWEWKRWIWWDGSRWIDDKSGAAALAVAKKVSQHYHKMAERMSRQASGESLTPEESKKLAAAAKGVAEWTAKCRSKQKLEAMLALSAKDARISISAADLDRDPWLLGVANGTVDLKTGTLRPASRDELVTQRSRIPFDPAAPAIRFRQFIAEITGTPGPGGAGDYQPRPALAGYLQRALGYCLTGSVAEQKMFIPFGEGSNGKSVLFDLAQEIAGDYCRTIEPKFLMAGEYLTNPESPSPVAATLAGARMAVSCESKDGQKLDIPMIKRHTGGGFLTARGMQQNTFRFEITHKLILLTNHKPKLEHLDFALQGRLHMIPFDRKWNRPGHPRPDPSLPNGDKDLMERLRAEAPGILAWLVEGALCYAKEGLEPPQEVAQTTQDYFAEQDPVGRWLKGYGTCEAKSGGTMAAELFRQFQQWQRDSDDFEGGGPTTSKAFGNALVERSISKHTTKDGARYGIVRNTDA